MTNQPILKTLLELVPRPPREPGPSERIHVWVMLDADEVQVVWTPAVTTVSWRPRQAERKGLYRVFFDQPIREIGEAVAVAEEVLCGADPLSIGFVPWAEAIDQWVAHAGEDAVREDYGGISLDEIRRVV